MEIDGTAPRVSDPSRNTAHATLIPPNIWCSAARVKIPICLLLVKCVGNFIKKKKKALHCISYTNVWHCRDLNLSVIKTSKVNQQQPLSPLITGNQFIYSALEIKDLYFSYIQGRGDVIAPLRAGVSITAAKPLLLSQPNSNRTHEWMQRSTLRPEQGRQTRGTNKRCSVASGWRDATGHTLTRWR